MLFEYSYINERKRKKRGVIEASNIDEAKTILRRQRLLLTSLEKVKQKKNTTYYLKKETLITFTTQLAALIEAGMPLYESLLSIAEQSHQEPFHPILITLCQQIKEGANLSEALTHFPKSFNRLYCNMVAAGEATGTLDKTLNKIVKLLSKQMQLKKQITTACIYPTLLFAFSLIVTLLLIVFVIPSLEELFEDRNVNRFTRCIMIFSQFLRTKWYYYIPLFMTMVFGIYSSLKSKKGRRWTQKQLLRLPILNRLIINIVITRFSGTMETLLKGGVSLIEALQISRKVMHNSLFEEVIEKAEKKIIEGSLLSIELKKSSLIPTLVSRMLSVSEESGTIALMFGKIADFYGEEVEKSLTRLTTLAQPIILIIMGGIVGTIMMAVLLPLTDVNAFL
ncbi:MAG: type II secretion system F family protein [Chlamydiales bacterium]